MRASPAVTRIAAIALVAAAVIFIVVSWRDPGYARLRLAGGPRSSAPHRDVATFIVEAPPFSLIELRVNGHRTAAAYVPWNARHVRFERTPLDDGRNEIVARTTLWYAASRKAHTTTLRLENPPAPFTGRDQRIRARWAGAPGLRSRNGRSLALNVRQQELDAAFAVQLRRTDRAIVALRGGSIDLPAFIDDVFGAPHFNRKPISGLFTGKAPRWYVAGDYVTVSADSGFQHLGLDDLPAFSGDVEIANAFSDPRIDVGGEGQTDLPSHARRPWQYDILRLHVDDYRVVATDPAPRQTDGRTYIWERPFAKAPTHATVSLSFAPFSSVDALRRGLNLPVFAFVPHVAARFLAFFHGFVLAVPMFAYLLLSRGRNTQFATVARRLIVVAVAADVFDACISAQPDVDGEILLMVPALRALPSSPVNLFVVPALIGLVLAALSFSVALLAGRARSAAGYLVADAANAVRIAALAFAGVAAVGYAVENLPRAPVVYPWLVAGVLTAGLIAILVSLDWWNIPGRGGSRAAFTIATVAFAVAVAVPIALVAFGAWATIPEHAGTAFADPLSPLPLSAAFLRSLAPLCPLAFGLLLISGVRPDPAALGLDRSRFARLMLCCYAVLPGMIVFVPIGFVFAWLTYDLLRERDAGPEVHDVPAVVTPRERGLAAVPLAFAFVLLEVLLLQPAELRYLRELHTPFIVLEAAGFIAVVVASFVLPAFAFAACSHELAGKSGFRKGVNVGGWAVACSLPAWFLGSDNVVTAVAVAILTVLFYTTLGCMLPASDATSGRLAFPRWRLQQKRQG